MSAAEGRDEPVQLPSVRESVAVLRNQVANALGILKRLDGLQDDLNAIGCPAPYRLKPRAPRAVLDPEVTDTGVAARLAAAMKSTDPVTRALTCVTAVEHLRNAHGQLLRRELRVASRLAAGAGSEGEESAAKRLSAALKDSANAVRAKTKTALRMLMKARHETLEAVCRIDEGIARAFPEPDVDLREATLANSSAGLVQSLALNERSFSEGPVINGKVKI